MNWQHEYLDALNLAANAGDVESQIALIEYHGRKYSYRYTSSDEIQIVGADHWDAELKNLEKAAKARHPEAQKRMGKYLFQGHPALNRDAIRGARLWLSGCIGARNYQRETLEKRLLKLADISDQARSIFRPERVKIKYSSNTPGKNGVCGIRIHHKTPKECWVVIEQLPSDSVPSVTNAAERIATQVLYKLLLAGKDVEAEKIQWFEVYPAGDDSAYKNGLLKQLVFDWNGMVYTSPRWEAASPSSVPLDLTDILILKDVT